MTNSAKIVQAELFSQAIPPDDPAPPTAQSSPGPDIPSPEPWHLTVVADMAHGWFQFEWRRPPSTTVIYTGWLRPTDFVFFRLMPLSWLLVGEGNREQSNCGQTSGAVHALLKRIRLRLPVADDSVRFGFLLNVPFGSLPAGKVLELPFPVGADPFRWLGRVIYEFKQLLPPYTEESKKVPGARGKEAMHALLEGLEFMGRTLLAQNKPFVFPKKASQAPRPPTWRETEKGPRARNPRIEPSTPFRSSARGERKEPPSKASPRVDAVAPPPAPIVRPPLPPLPVHLEMPALALQDTAFSLPDLRGYLLRERAACWWVSNQSDDLLALPHCRIQRLEYQVRSALRVLGPLRGRALLSDEVGLGKTIEAGLVLKELLTRGMVRRFLVLTVPSLVDQWEEELNDKFNLPTATTNHAVARADLGAFWRDHPAIVASLHTLKQPQHLEVARAVNWDLLIVDEAHYLRNRESQAWQAVNALPRQFLLLLTATPVQNSLEELYNLITLLQPGQLPTPKEFRARFVDPKRPRQPREPEELRRLLGQVMIRNTRANAGLNLPPRRAETILFEPTPAEREFWQNWETELRGELSRLPASQATLWGRLLLQTAGSSPAAWRNALNKFPNQTQASAWRELAPLDESWQKKNELLEPLTRGEGGVVIFTQFLETQAALAERLRTARVETFVINGSIPAVQRQPLTEEFRRRGGALLLTHSGTEGRNLQFCHRLVNFDLPWNPMEIEQRIGRLHRLGQEHPVRIYNLVQAGTLQEHLLQILQEKLNLFELVVGETGLILGDRFSNEEFADEILRRWRESDGRVAESLQTLGEELAAARDGYQEIKKLDETLFAKDYESL